MPPSNSLVRHCPGGFGGPEDGEACRGVVRFSVERSPKGPLYVCAAHLGPALLLAERVVWPPKISLVR